MNDFLKTLQAVMTNESGNFPLLWKDQVEISSRLEHTLSVTRGVPFGTDTQLVPVTEEGARLVVELAARGVNREDAKKVVAIFEQADGITL